MSDFFAQKSLDTLKMEMSKTKNILPSEKVIKWHKFLRLNWKPTFTRAFSHAKSYVRFAGIANDDSVLEFCSGTGIITVEIAKIAKSVFCVEKNRDYVEKTRDAIQKLGFKNIKFFNIDICNKNSMAKLYREIGNKITKQLCNPDFSIIKEVLIESRKYSNTINIILPRAVFNKRVGLIEDRNLYKAALFLKQTKYKIIKKESLSYSKVRLGTLIVRLNWQNL